MVRTRKCKPQGWFQAQPRYYAHKGKEESPMRYKVISWERQKRPRVNSRRVIIARINERIVRELTEYAKEVLEFHYDREEVKA